jgi:hypothetical protein
MPKCPHCNAWYLNRTICPSCEIDAAVRNAAIVVEADAVPVYSDADTPGLERKTKAQEKARRWRQRHPELHRERTRNAMRKARAK